MTSKTVEPPVSKVPAGSDLLSLYTHQHGLADSSLATEREITIKNFATLGAVLLLQAGFFTTTLKPHVVFFGCGLIIVVISLVARAMAIFYGKYTARLFTIANIYRKAYLRGRDGFNVLDKEDESKKAKTLPNSETLSFYEFITYPGALAAINTIPAVIGLALIVLGVFAFYGDPGPWWALMKTDGPSSSHYHFAIFGLARP